MKNLFYIFLLSFLIFHAGDAYGQRPPGQQIDPERLQAARIAFITTRIDLTPEQAEKFWPIFNQFTEQKEATMRQIANLGRGANEVSEEEAKSRIQQRFQLEEKMIKDERAFVAEASKVLTSKQILMLNNIARDFTRQLYQRQRGGGN
ncbi:hypothetical protein DFQ04_1169 [Algoriphagus boseongensis]|uniref:LTXXQ motif family protein n=1 Tax=Algoriphagus boseongensis TaxID=1442587 RepID=A0A4R6T807_9BACT|nr:hypothetical protein [Algoriphagus boseongensis]TDQ19348.1 hypothetical protein DFQ04_1169 [Algoriphagus boseongensis]